VSARYTGGHLDAQWFDPDRETAYLISVPLAAESAGKPMGQICEEAAPLIEASGAAEALGTDQLKYRMLPMVQFTLDFAVQPDDEEQP
jgi:hypothetical protein